MSARTLTLFVGPSLRSDDHEALRARIARRAGDGLTIVVLPPVRRGDLANLVTRGAPGDAVLIVDGEFGQELAVSVLEIREALRSGVLVMGASSMGALRAAESDLLGMLGFGWVFRGLRAGQLNSDAEVALLFDPHSYEPLTVPLVNVRWVAHLLNAQGKISHGEESQLTESAARVHFRARTIGALGHAWEKVPTAAPGARDLLIGMLDGPGGRRYDRKRLDALEAIELAELLATSSGHRDLVPECLLP